MIEATKGIYKRYLAVDIHKRYLEVGGVNIRQEVVLTPCRLDYEHWEGWMKANLKASDAIVIEATTNAWHIYDQVATSVGRAVVAHPGLVKLIAYARVKTDKRDVLNLARLLAADLIPEVWVPPQEVREMRALLAHRRHMVKRRTMLRNRLHSVIHRYNLIPPTGDLFGEHHQEWWQQTPLSAVEHLLIRQDLAALRYLEPQIAECDAMLEKISGQALWQNQVVLLLQIPGFGLQTVMTVLAAVGEVYRFPTSKHLVGYAGLGAGVHISGETHHTGRITKQGRKELRWIMVEAAWSAVRWDPYWQARFERLAKCRGQRKAIVAIARKLLTVVWHVLTKKEAYRQANPEKVAYKLFRWTWRLDENQRLGLQARQFVRYHLLNLNIGHDLQAIHHGGKKRTLPPPDEVLNLIQTPLVTD
jgi:transposase